MAITNAIMQMRRGLEADFDPDKMQPGEWAVSLDKKYVRMCFSVGVCVRMATYDAFEEDMAQIEEILSKCETIEEAVAKINTEVSANAKAVAEYTEQAKKYRDEAKQFRDEAEQFAPEGYVELQEAVASNTAKIDTIIEKAELNIKNIASGENIHLTDSASSKVVEFGLYGKATQDGEPTPDNPIEIVVSGSDGSVEVVSCGKNLLKNFAKSQTVNGVTFTIENGIVTANGTSTNIISFSVASRVSDKFKLPIGKYILSGCPSGGSWKNYLVETTYTNSNNTSTALDYDMGDGKNIEITESMLSPYFSIGYNIVIQANVTLNNLVFKPMIRLASDTDDTFEPYTETTSTIPTPNGLCGIKVSSGGNYTDENGHQWITDEIVKYADGSGKRIQRIGKAVFDGSDDEGWVSEGTNTTDKYRKRTSFLSGLIKPPSANTVVFNGMANLFKVVPSGGSGSTYQCDTGISCGISTNVQVYSDGYNTSDTSLWTAYLAENPMTLYYELATPIITDLTAEEIAEIEKLHTFYPITNISNDANCGMSVTYLCDAKNYIDNRLALIETALVNSI